MTDKSKRFLKNFDIDGDGTFSFEEFILLLVMLSMPLKDMRSIFVLMDADGSGTVEKNEFISSVDKMLSMAGHQHKTISRGHGINTPARKECVFSCSCHDGCYSVDAFEKHSC
jgi:hypothetical protein